MLFGEWQAQMMLEKGQTTEGVRVDKKIVINPLFKGKYGFVLVNKDRRYCLSTGPAGRFSTFLLTVPGSPVSA